jgi:hypothetical protein
VLCIVSTPLAYQPVRTLGRETKTNKQDYRPDPLNGWSECQSRTQCEILSIEVKLTKRKFVRK